MIKEGIKRSLTKAITYRIICIVMLAIVSFIFTGDLREVTGIVVVFQGIQMVIYYIHERVWERVQWGPA
jgi:uncharacterized membrane protein